MCAIKSTDSNSTRVVTFLHGVLSWYRCALRRERQALLADCRPRHLAAQALELLALVRLGGDARMQRESADLAGIAFGRIRIGGDRLQRRALAPCVLAGGDAVGDRTHPQCVQAVVAACAVGQKCRLVFAFKPAFAHQPPTHPVRDGIGQLSRLRKGGRAGAMQARFVRPGGHPLVREIESPM